jgi:nitrogen regulatory protein P-II 1
VKLVSLLIEPFRLDAVREHYTAAGVQGMTVTEAGAVGIGRTEVYRGSEVSTGLDPLVRIEVLVADADVESVISSATAAGAGGRESGGRLWVTPVEDVVRVRTGERGPDAL